MLCYAIYGVFQMTSRKEMSRMNRMVDCIRKEKRITKVQLVMKSGISISYYEKLKPFMEELFQHTIRYDKDTKSWIAIDSYNQQ